MGVVVLPGNVLFVEKLFVQLACIIDVVVTLVDRVRVYRALIS